MNRKNYEDKIYLRVSKNRTYHSKLALLLTANC